MEFGLAHPNHYRVAFMMRVESDLTPEDYRNPESMGCRAFLHLRQGVQACVDAGKLKNRDIDSVSQALWAGIHGVTSLMIAHPHFPWTDQNRVIDLLIDGPLAG